MKQITLFLLAMLFIVSCQTSTKDKDNKTATSKTETEQTDNSLSIFQLPSEWETQEDETIELESLKGNVLAVVMIYTSCQAACPRLVADMKNIQEKVGDNTKKPVKYVFVSIDPETDTPQRFKEFSVENNMTDDKWLFLRSSEDNTREFANVLAVQYKEISPIDFSHSNIISVFDENGVLVHQQEGLGVDNDETIQAIQELAS